VRASREGRSDPVLVFIHIPKTAGTTIRAVIRANAPGEANRRPGANVFQGGGGVVVKVLDKLREEAASIDLDDVHVLHGHYPLGIREYLEPAFPQLEFRYLTFLRNPIERSLSHYFRLRERHLPFEDAISAGYLHDNLQTRMLSGEPEPFGEVTEAMLERAKRNVRDTFALVGITERLSESLVLAKHRLGFNDIVFERAQRVNASRPRASQVDGELRAAAERVNRFDVELYRYAAELFDHAAEREQLEFHVELAALEAVTKPDKQRSPAAPGPFRGGEREWRMLLELQSRVLRLRHEASRRAQSAVRTRSEVARPRSSVKARRKRPRPKAVGAMPSKG